MPYHPVKLEQCHLKIRIRKWRKGQKNSVIFGINFDGESICVDWAGEFRVW